MGNGEEINYEVEFMNFVIDKADDLKIVDGDSHFSAFTGVHPSKIRQGKLFLYDILRPSDRENIMQVLCKKNSPYLYFDTELIDKNSKSVYVHCTAHSRENSTLCRLTAARVFKATQKQQALMEKAREMNYLIDVVTGGICLFKVTADMHIDVLYLNRGGCRIFDTTKEVFSSRAFRIDELIHPEDKSEVFQAIGRAMATEEDVDMEFRITVHKGEYRWCKFCAGIQQYDEDNNPVFHAMFMDITGIKE